ncbi:hypothetical protein GCM10022206_34210 [Streptomyces chiangmaiensis]
MGFLSSGGSAERAGGDAIAPDVRCRVSVLALCAGCGTRCRLMGRPVPGNPDQRDPDAWPRIRKAVGAPASTPKATHPGPGRPKGRNYIPAPRHPVGKKRNKKDTLGRDGAQQQP